MAEIDIQQTKDGELFLMHDSNLKRTTGYNGKVSDVTYEQIKTLDAGRWFSDEFIAEPIPTLEEALQKSKGKITLMIEIKTKEHLVNVAYQVIESHSNVWNGKAMYHWSNGLSRPTGGKND